MTNLRVYSLWQNALMALSSVLFAIPGLVGYSVLKEAPGGRLTSVLAIMILLAWVGLCVWLAVRSLRLGVYGDSGRVVKIRSLLRTWSVPVDQVTAIHVFEGGGSWSRKFYFPMLLIEGTSRRQGLGLWWLSAMDEPRAREYAVRVQALLAA